RREAAAFEGWTRRASDGARERVFVVLDARIGLDVLEARIGPQRADGAMSRAPAAAAGAGSGAGPLATAGPGPGLTGGIGGFGPSLMD
ncbi:hypothetical protein OFB92_32650, partial [Escherichia coli]|nr:hypothetical protein [Escherichia coli]